MLSIRNKSRTDVIQLYKLTSPAWPFPSLLRFVESYMSMWCGLLFLMCQGRIHDLSPGVGWGIQVLAEGVSKLTQIHSLSTCKQMFVISICFNKRYRSSLINTLFFLYLSYLSCFLFTPSLSHSRRGRTPSDPPLEPPMSVEWKVLTHVSTKIHHTHYTVHIPMFWTAAK